MSKVFVIPDVHLKPWIFKKASESVNKKNYDVIVMLGDLVDDWDQEENLKLYNETFDAAIEFVTRYPNTRLCYGNHDVSYRFNRMESGFSTYAADTVNNRLEELENNLRSGYSAYIHMIDKVLFSHAGLTKEFVERHFEMIQFPSKYDLNYIVNTINKMGADDLWTDDSPIWTRPQKKYDGSTLYPPDMMQVVGHTPVRTALEEKNLLTLDSFSTYRDGRPIGDERFVWVDTAKRTWRFTEE